MWCRISATHFVAGIDFLNYPTVVRTAPILKSLWGNNLEQVEKYCSALGYSIEIFTDQSELVRCSPAESRQS